MFRGEIFIPKKKPFLNLTLSEKLSWGSLISIILLAYILEKFKDTNIESIFKISIFFCLIIFIYSSILRFQEFENLNGELKGKLIIDESEIIIDNKIYDLSKIQDFKIKITDYFGQRTNYSKSGPYYYQGINNMLSFNMMVK